MIEKEKDKLIDWIDENEKYEFLWHCQGFTDKQLIETKKTIEKLDKILEKTAQEIKKLGKTKIGRKLGMGDTTTDEAITDKLYTLIH